MSRDFIMRKLTRGSGILAFLLIGAVAPGSSYQVPGGSGTQDKQEHRGHSAIKANLVDAREGHAMLWKEPDAKDSGGDTDERIYYVSDLGASFGSTGSLVRKLIFFSDPPAGTKNDPSGYAHQTFIDGVRNGEVRFHYKGKDQSALKGITVENARWMGNMLGRLSEKQLGDAFRAAGFDDSEIATYVRAMHERIGELQNLK